MFCSLQLSDKDLINLLYIIAVFLTEGMNQTCDVKTSVTCLHTQAVAPSGISSAIHDRKHAGVKAIWMRQRKKKVSVGSDRKMENIFRSASPNMSEEIQRAVLGTILSGYRRTEQ